MQAGTKVNISMAFAVFGPLLLWLGLFAMGTPGRTPTAEPTAPSALFTEASICLGLALVAGSVWLSVSAVRAAPRRTTSAWIVCFALLAGLVVFA